VTTQDLERPAALETDRGAARDVARPAGAAGATGSRALDEVLERRGGLVGLVDRLSRRGSVSRRGFFVGAAVAGSALATNPRAYALMPQTAYATICGPGNTSSSGWTIFCATINKGVNGCPPGSFTAGWWKAADSSWCGGGYRYIVDCNARCTKCTTGCSDHICDSRCWNCSCSTGSTATCDQRRNCCNAFRYGQCNTQVKCSGGVHCRVVSCVAPYTWDNCSTTSFRSDSTAEHSSPYLPQWGPMEQLYTSMGGQGSYLKASAGPIRTTIDGTAKYVNYTGGRIWWTSRTGASAMTSFILERYAAVGGPAVLGYPKGAKLTGLRDGGWLQVFEKGCLTDSASTTTQAVYGIRWTRWVDTGRETGLLRYPVAGVETLAKGWIQRFQKGCIVDSDTTSTTVVHNYAWQGWQEVGREGGVLGFPTSDRAAISRGYTQAFQRGGLWGLAGARAYAVHGTVLAAWRAAGGPAGSYGFPTAHVVDNGDGTGTGRFEGGTIRA
jgi:LGFP repeat